MTWMKEHEKSSQPSTVKESSSLKKQDRAVYSHSHKNQMQGFPGFPSFPTRTLPPGFGKLENKRHTCRSKNKNGPLRTLRVQMIDKLNDALDHKPATVQILMNLQCNTVRTCADALPESEAAPWARHSGDPVPSHGCEWAPGPQGPPARANPEPPS